MSLDAFFDKWASFKARKRWRFETDRRTGKKVCLIFPGRFKYWLYLPEGVAVPLVKKPKKIRGGYLTADGRRYVRSEWQVELYFNGVRGLRVG